MKHIAEFVADAWFSETKLDKDKKSDNLPNMKLNTVNVIELTDGLPQGMTSYPDTAKGNDAAEEHFKAIIKELYPNTADEDVDDAIENGWYSNGDYSVCLVHSS